MPRYGFFSFSGTPSQSISRLDEIVLVVGALRAAEDHGAGVVLHRLRQRIVEARAADVEG